ncbi:MAG TPA: DNA primase [Isosphaeraceae bacterium]|nr:DNA primase [Isosphaeraceae bacterium]
MPRHSEATLAAVKSAVDIVALVGEYLPLHRSGSKFKALCPFHDDHNPSLELNPERQSFKCWSCGAGGDVFDFVKDYERVDFPEALRMLAERAGVALGDPSSMAATARGPSKTELFAVNAWAERVFAEALAHAPEVMAYIARRGIIGESIGRFGLGYAPDARDWLLTRARREGYTEELLEKAGLIVRSNGAQGTARERFRGRLIFPIHDPRGRPLGFGGRILPAIEEALAKDGKHAAKYLNSPETAVFQKRRVLYAADLARAAARAAGWVAVVEGYTDVIAAHQVGLANFVGTLGTALGGDHVLALRRLADRVVLIFDGDEAGQSAADRALELFLGHEVDVRVLTLPEGFDPCDFLLTQGADAFRSLVDRAVDPLAFTIARAGQRFDLDSLEDSRRAAEWVLAILGRIPKANRAGLDVKLGKALDTLSRRLRVPVETLEKRLRQLRGASARSVRAERPRPEAPDPPPTVGPASAPIRPADLDPTDRELVRIVLNEPRLVGPLISRVPTVSIREAPLRTILQASYDLYREGQEPTFERIALRLEDSEIRALAAGLLLPFDPQPPSEGMKPGPVDERLRGVLASIAERDRQQRLRDVQEALKETDAAANPDDYRALQRELYRLSTNRPDTKTKNAS